MNKFLFVYAFVVSIAVSAMAYLAYRSTEGGRAARLFMGLIAFLVFWGFLYIVLVFLLPLVG